ncbi:MAG: urease accessory protein UreD [Amaricoccus sp.]|uniref:urease accessory protein UreD n=1 Tax=Amaricoccus sp. TaxID=1872485 RepID=UPI0039E56008
MISRPSPDGPPADPAPRLQRARGRAEVAVRHDGTAVRLERLFQQGSAKAILPRVHGPVPEVVLVNTAGGVTGGDAFAWSLAAGDGAALVATTQAAERVYRSTGGPAEIRTRLALGTGAALDWLPQETIVFDGGRLDRRIDIDLAADSRLLAVETLVLGRTAMGETVATGALSDQWRLRRAGRLIHAEALRAEGDIARATAGPATLAGGRAVSTVVLAAPGAADRRDEIRDLLKDEAHVAHGVSKKPDLLIVRLMGPDARALRTTLIRLLMRLRGTALPRVWST